MARLVLESNIVIVVAVAVILSGFPMLWFKSDTKLRPIVHVIIWASAFAILGLRSLVRPIYDDEVFYMAQAFASLQGEVHGCLPLRLWIYYPFIALHLSPGITLITGRITMMIAACLAGVLVMQIGRKLNLGSTSSIAGALSVLTLGSLPMGTMVPEFVALVFLLTAVWALVAAPWRLSRVISLFLAGLMFGLACTISLRLSLLSAAGLLAVYLEPGDLRRINALFWTCVGMFASVLPSAFYILAKDSISSMIYWNFTFIRKMNLIHFESPLELPAFLASMALAGCYLLWNARGLGTRIKTLLLLWATATVSAILNPIKLEHALGPWLALSLILAAAGMNQVLIRVGEPTNRRVYTLLLVLLFLTLIAPNAQMLTGSSIRKDAVAAGSGLRLIDWLASVADGNPVACVPPFHPMWAANAWHMWNVIYYCYIRDPELNSELDPGLESVLRSRKIAVLAWDPWPKESEQPNLLGYLADRAFVSDKKIPLLAAELCKNYRLVKWKEPLPEEFGGGRFLVRRDIHLDNRVTVLEDSLISQEP